ncbi:MAG: peptidylprolyl isomerase [Candidatus Thermoplasmatota archaeon]|nr:peptidylprolyl isomerase [Candidatus Thermoplasmatota archaeon]
MGRETRNRIIMAVIAIMMITSVTVAVVLSNAPEDQWLTFDDTTNPVAGIRTNYGTIYVELYPDDAPITVANFMRYVNDSFYNNLIFHRVIDGFMIQGGGFTENMVEKETYDPIKNEAGNGLGNDIYTIAMARTNVVDSATSQFFINVDSNSFLNHKDNTTNGYGYAVFGKVIYGQDIVMAISKVATHSVGSYDDVPINPVIIENVKMVQ